MQRRFSLNGLFIEISDCLARAKVDREEASLSHARVAQARFRKSLQFNSRGMPGDSTLRDDSPEEVWADRSLPLVSREEVLRSFNDRRTIALQPNGVTHQPQ